MALSQAFAADPVFSLEVDLVVSLALHAWLNSGREARSNQQFFDVFVLFQGRASTDCHERTSSEIAKEQRLCERAHCSVSERHKQSTLSRRRAGATDLDGTYHMWKHPPEHLSHQPPFPSTKITLAPSQHLHHAPSEIQNFRRTDHRHPLQSMCSRDSVWHSVTVHEDFDAVPTLPPILHACPRSPWKTTRTECCSNAARRTSRITVMPRGNACECWKSSQRIGMETPELATSR